MDGISKAARVGQMIIGVVYIVAGALKTWEPVLFYWEAIPYAQMLGIVEWEVRIGSRQGSHRIGAD